MENSQKKFEMNRCQSQDEEIIVRICSKSRRFIDQSIFMGFKNSESVKMQFNELLV